jgi:hypothetical protein
MDAITRAKEARRVSRLFADTLQEHYIDSFSELVKKMYVEMGIKIPSENMSYYSEAVRERIYNNVMWSMEDFIKAELNRTIVCI